uniref:Uncharacterized protein n=1 Tax=Chrysotila carterae TaxID=13221 RepID=A0A7S4BZ21_CHRCT
MLFDAVARASVARRASISSMMPQPQAALAITLANTAWAFATAGHPSTLLFDAVARASVASVDQFDPQALANTAWAFATAGHPSPLLFDEVARASAEGCTSICDEHRSV